MAVSGDLRVIAPRRARAAAPATPVNHGGFFSSLGPGLITGAADDDPSGIATYSIAGATLGYAPLWTSLASFPLMAGVQLMCGRLGLVTGFGLAGVIRRRYPRWVLWAACALLCVANVINIAADLSAMAETTELIVHVRASLFLPLYGILVVCALVWSSYRTIARIFKWLTLVLGAYIAAAFLANVDWAAALRSTIVPRLEWSPGYFSVLVAIFGTTMSPYLFFWQAAQEVEEERAQGRKSVAERRGATATELRDCRTDVAAGMFASTAVMYFIIVTAAATLHQNGHTTIGTAREAAEALRPLAGDAAYWLFSIGIIGTGMLAVPVLAGSCAYAVAEAAAWKQQSLAARPHRARKFYATLAIAVAIGWALTYVGFTAIRLLFVSAVINGVLAPPLVLIVVLLTSDREVMGDAVSSRALRLLGWAAFAVMTASAIGLAVTAR
jgi:NRAMP (natural resistance-associated macrophage protein)-like metal ion transporter